MPTVAFVIATTAPVIPAVKAALLVLAVSAGAPLLPRKLSLVGNDAYIFGPMVTSSLLAIFTVPVWVALLARLFEVSEQISALDVAIPLA